jgi:hypothetical protein
MRTLLATSAVFLIASGHSLAEAARSGTGPARYEQPCEADGQDDELSTQLAASLSDGRRVEVALVTACLDLATYPRPDAEHWMIVPAHARTNPDIRYIREMAVTFDGEGGMLTVSAFGDLLFRTYLDAEIVESGPDAVVRLTGSASGMGRWIATYRFEDRWLVERYVTTSTFPDVAFQRTQYGRPMNN